MSEPQEDGFRLSRYLARAGIAARRKSEELITGGRVVVNGEVCRDFSRRIDPARDTVLVDGKPALIAANITLAMFKPARCLTSRGDPGGRPTIYDLIAKTPWHARAAELVYVGRLDWDTEGLLLVTTDGDLAHRATHPSFHVTKEYWIATRPPVRMGDIGAWRTGVELEDGPARAVEAELLPDRPDGFQARIVVAEGRNRLVRRMAEAVGTRAVALRRVRFGPLELGGMREGEVREVGAEELTRLFEASKALP